MDTAYFTPAGQARILLLIQLGGLGIISFAIFIIAALGRRLSLRHASLVAGATGVTPHVDYRRLTRDVFRFTLGLEAVGAVLLYLLLGPRLSWTEAAWPALFYSISAFCNAGFSTFSDSLMGFQEAPLLLLVVMVLIVTGGLGLSLFSVERGERKEYYQFLVQPVYMPAPSECEAAGDGAAGGGAAQEMIGVILLLRDVTKLRELDRLKSEFVATASHELKTPLTSIGMSIELLEERAEALSEEDREALSVASEEVEQLRAPVGDLLDLSKIEAGRMEMHPEVAAPSVLIGRAAQQFALQAEKKSVALRQDVPEGLPRVQADAGRIGQVLNNLLSNARRHTPEGGGVQLAAEVARGEVRFCVEDTGEGIPPEHLPELFGKFAGGQRALCRRQWAGDLQGDHRGARRPHRGRLDARRRRAVFTFTLPVADEEAA